jgi:pimeloyl-ACP methyl ester carboxylesterase
MAAVEPDDLRCPTLIYAGALDAAVVEPMAAYDAAALASAGVRSAVLDGLDHAGAFSATEAVLPLALPFLRAWAR